MASSRFSVAYRLCEENAAREALLCYNEYMDKGSKMGVPVPDLPQPDAPLAARMRPRTLDEIVGQEHVLAPGKTLRRAIEADRVPSLVLWG
ncbi:MAG: putative ATPase, partial [Chloroflexia bacterium]|nr:putative ATPase [Chloroflexia bacterium]